MPRILLVEDSASSQQLVNAALPKPAFDLVCVTTVADAKAITEGESAFDLILLDLGLPDGVGLDLLGQWRASKRFAHVPVLLLTGKEDVETKLEAFALGAEDYLIKPVNPRELKGRVEMRLRKSSEAKAPNDTLHKGRLTLNFPLMRATINEEGHEVAVDLTSKEFRLLATLAQHEGQIFTRSELVHEIWGADTHVVNRTVDSHICGARRKLGLAGSYIQSVTGSGYRFVVKE